MLAGSELGKKKIQKKNKNIKKKKSTYKNRFLGEPLGVLSALLAILKWPPWYSLKS